MPHRAHQLVGIEELVLDLNLDRTAEHAGITYRREIPKVFALLDEVGCGKTKQCIDAAQILFLRHKIDTVVSLTPGFARSTWADEDPMLGEVAKHAWSSVPNVVHEFHGKYAELDLSADALHWVVSNYEFIRRDGRLQALIDQLKGRTTWLIVDESWAVKGNSQQTKAVWKLRRKRADRVTILNGTPLADGKPNDLFYQFAILDPAIIGCKNRTHFRSKHCIVGGYQGKSVVGYQNLDELNARIAPYVLSRRTRDCFDLPPMLPPLTLEARLSDARWKTYREMRDDMVAWLGTTEASISKQAITKALRLSQITAGYLGGVETIDAAAADPDAQAPAWLRQRGGLPFENQTIRQEAAPTGGQTPSVEPARLPITRELGREKLDAFLLWLSTLARPDKLVAWCRFTPELERATLALGALYPTVLNLRGGQSKEDRRAAKEALAPGSQGRAVVVGNPKAGGASLNFSAANIMVFLSNGPALIERTQSIGRIERPGATQPMLVVDVVATGPKGQKTIDHHILKSLRAKDDMARWTVQRWREILVEE